DVSGQSWHAMTARAMQALGATEVELEGWGPGLVWEGKGAARPRARRGGFALEPISLPRWLFEQAPPESRPPRPLAPSQIIEDRDSAPPPGPAMRAAARRGTLLHALFERLPGVGPDQRYALASRWLERAGVGSEERDEIAAAACSLIADPAFAELFGPASLA